jgi:glycine/D-amino acid oxidase-like deaminating enzyme
MISFWERESFISSDFIVVGGGITGLSAALSLREKHPKSKITLLERGIFPSGASTKNAGFACFGSLTEILADLETMGESDMLALIETRRSGLAKLNKRLGKTKIDYQQHGGYELISDKEKPALNQLQEVNKLLFPLFGEPVFSLKNNSISKFCFNANKVKALVFNPFEGQIDTGKMMRALIAKVAAADIAIYTGADVLEINQITDGADVVVSSNIHKKINFKAKKVLVCTNAFTKKFFPKIDLAAGRGQVLVTKPIKDLPFKGTFHFDEGFYYFRNFGNRVIFGGGRNIDITGETTSEIATTHHIQKDLKEKLQTLILSNVPFKVEHSWAGIMAFGKNKKPVIKKVSADIAVAVRLGGMGVAIGTSVGEEGARLISQD